MFDNLKKKVVDVFVKEGKKFLDTQLEKIKKSDLDRNGVEDVSEISAILEDIKECAITIKVGGERLLFFADLYFDEFFGSKEEKDAGNNE